MRNDKRFKDKKDKTYQDQTDFGYKEFKVGSPTNEKVSPQSQTYNTKAFRDLQNVRTIEVKADPNSSVIKGAHPYPIINATNKVVDANYAGRSNIEGNMLTRLQNSNQSGLNNYFDIAAMMVRLNYLYLCYSTSDQTGHNNLAVNAEMLKTFNEAISKAYSTMTTQLPYYVDTISTNMPIPSDLSAAEQDLYGKLGGLLHYQTVLQNACAPISKYIQTMSLEQTVLDMSYRREAPLVTALFGLLNKSAFKATLNALGTTLIGEYFDVNWYKQMNTLVYTPSRKSNSIVDPLLTAVATTSVPSCTMKTPSNDVYYNSDNVLKASGVWLNPDSFTLDGTTEEPMSLTFEQIIYRLLRLLDVSTILTWARKLNTDATSVGTLTSASAYYQCINRYIEVLNVILTKFSTSMTDIRTFLDKLSQSGMVYWKRGVTLSVNHIQTFDPTYNVILHNMIACYIGGSAEMTYDTSTQRWQASTLWNKYTGIPEFDRISGGSFLTFGLRNLNLGSLSPTDIAMCLPVMFATELTTGSSKCLITNRKGVRLEVKPVTTNNIINNNTLARLDPLNVGYKVKIPTVDISSFTSSEKPKLASTLQQFLLNIIGYGDIKLTNSSSITACDPDYVCFLDLQLEDVSNEMIQFCRNYSPFRVSTPDGRRTIGFGS